MLSRKQCLVSGASVWIYLIPPRKSWYRESFDGAGGAHNRNKRRLHNQRHDRTWPRISHQKSAKYSNQRNKTYLPTWRYPTASDFILKRNIHIQSNNAAASKATKEASGISTWRDTILSKMFFALTFNETAACPYMMDSVSYQSKYLKLWWTDFSVCFTKCTSFKTPHFWAATMDKVMACSLYRICHLKYRLKSSSQVWLKSDRIQWVMGQTTKHGS